ncbi:hypothetical protein AB0C28_49100 [Nonomuraea sp. NPDC048892]|uniref:hypothetical protein n=1 Tax=Nonomuraea sp. NPDC048892 TaxID=3154624 RepID=UPI0033DE3878
MDNGITPVASGAEPAMDGQSNAVTADATNETEPAFENDADRWKHFSRLNENKWKAATEELEAQRAKATELENAVAQMRQEHSLNLASIELSHQASLRGIDLDSEAMTAVNMSSFIGEDGTVDAKKIDNFLDRFGSPKHAFPSGADLGIGRAGGKPTTEFPLDVRHRR